MRKEDVKKNVNSENLLVIMNGKVFDVSEFAADHPGGADFFHEYAGEDITAVMADGSIHAHSDSAYELLQTFYMCDLQEEDTTLSQTIPLTPPETPELKKKTLYDHSKPLFPQLWDMDISKAEYLRLVHIPHHSKESFRFFYSDYMEVLSRTHWWVVPLVWLPVILLHVLHTNSVYGPTFTAVAFVIGVLVWTIVEYTLHRFLFHLDESLPDNKIAIMLHFTLHGVHHYFPMDKLRLVFPPAPAAILYSILCGILLIFVPLNLIIALVGGVLFGYVCYDLTHYYLHHGVPSGEYLRFLKTYHLDHHYKNYHEGYGISTDLWDRVFHTGFSS